MISSDIRSRLKTRRLALGLSAEAVAARCGISPASVYRFENGDIKSMRLDKLMLLAHALHTSPDYLIGWDNEAPPITDDFALRTLVDTAKHLNPAGLAKLQEYAQDLANHPRYAAPQKTK